MTKTNQNPTIIDSIKLKLLESGAEYFKSKFETTKEDILKYVEKTVEKKIKKELKKIIYQIIAIFLLIVGTITLIFGLIGMLVHFANLPNFFTPLLIGILLLLTSLIVYLQK